MLYPLSYEGRDAQNLAENRWSGVQGQGAMLAGPTRVTHPG